MLKVQRWTATEHADLFHTVCLTTPHTLTRERCGFLPRATTITPAPDPSLLESYHEQN